MGGEEEGVDGGRCWLNLVFFPKNHQVIFLSRLESVNNHKMKFLLLKLQSCKLYNNKYMITSTPITNTESDNSFSF